MERETDAQLVPKLFDHTYGFSPEGLRDALEKSAQRQEAFKVELDAQIDGALDRYYGENPEGTSMSVMLWEQVKKMQEENDALRKENIELKRKIEFGSLSVVPFESDYWERIFREALSECTKILQMPGIPDLVSVPSMLRMLKAEGRLQL